MKIKEKSAIVLLLITSFGLLNGYDILNKEQLSLVVKGEEKKVSTFKKTVAELLNENEIKYDKNDIITPSLSSEVKDYMNIKVVDVTTSKMSEEEEIPFEVKSIDDNSILKGKTEVAQEGKAGKKEKTYDLTYYDGKLIKKELASEIVSEDPVEKVVKKGIKEEIIVASRSATSRNNNPTQNNNQPETNSGNHMTVEATAYAGDTITSTGTVPKWGTIAVDPRVIPYGTRVYIPQFDMTFVAEDCGGAIKGNRIDIFMNSESQCVNWGRRAIDIYVK